MIQYHYHDVMDTANVTKKNINNNEKNNKMAAKATFQIKLLSKFLEGVLILKLYI